MIDFPDENLAVAGVLGPLTLDDVLLAAGKANRVAPLQIVRADRIVGADHLRAAARAAQRAMDEGRNHADRLEVEFTRYTAGRRQIRKALDHLGVDDGCAAAVVCAFGTKRLDALPYFIDYLGLREDDSVLEASKEKMEAFGITPEQRAATTPGHELDIVLEAVAAVDLMRK